MTYKKSSWKQKVDPALIDNLKSVVKLFDSILQMQDPESKDIIEKIKEGSIKSFKPFYERSKQEKQFIDFMKFVSKQSLSEIKDNRIKQKDIKAEMEKRLTPEMILFLTFQNLNFVCFLVYKKSLKKLCEEAKKGNEDSLLKLLRFDKTLFDHEWFKEIIMRKVVEGNYYFFEKIGDAIKKEPPLGKKKRGKLQIVLLISWNSIFKKLTWNERLRELDKLGLTEKMDLDSLKKFVKREVLPLISQ